MVTSATRIGRGPFLEDPLSRSETLLQQKPRGHEALDPKPLNTQELTISTGQAGALLAGGIVIFFLLLVPMLEGNFESEF